MSSINFNLFDMVYKSLGLTVPEQELSTYAVTLAEGSGGIQGTIEWAALMANLMHESANFTATKEYACQPDPSACASYGTGPNGQVYYGRGYIQLTGPENYHEASSGIFGDDRLYQNPDLVSDQPAVAWATTYWYWKNRVHNSFNPNDFGSSVLAINGVLECHGGGTVAQTQDRFNKYKQILGIVAPGAIAYCSCPGVN